MITLTFIALAFVGGLVVAGTKFARTVAKAARKGAEAGRRVAEEDQQQSMPFPRTVGER